LKSKTKLQRDIKRGKSEKEILKQINQRKKDFLKFILPQTKFSDISITTLSRDSDEALFSIDVKSQYFYELESLLNEIAHISEKEILKQISQRKKDFLKFILPQSKFSDISITTLSRDSDQALFSIDIKSQYFYELENLLNEISHITEKEILENDDRIKFILRLNKMQIEDIFGSLSREIQNLKSRKFQIDTLDEFNQELMLKLSLILFLLNKKFENRL